ncbi:MAG: helix-hairpin-helix domain-containing protein [Phycisphaerales bacterium]|nr:helix-hairpin-helix domain-containing protein [Phycisphaerales bacterium]
MLGWTRRQRRVLGVGLLVLLVGYGAWWAGHRRFIPIHERGDSHGMDELADRLDVNTASREDLAALPALGLSRAGVIVEYREEFVRRHPGSKAFERAEDLLKVKGIGVAMVEQLRAYLEFPDPTTEPMTGGR